MNRKSTVLLSLFLALGASSKEVPGSGELLTVFDAKGSNLGWDAGVIEALYERLNFSKIKKIRFAGSSSGSLYAAFFACRGLNQSSVQEIKTNMEKFKRSMISENESVKIAKLSIGVPTEVPLSNVAPLIDMVTMHSSCVPKEPVLIVAGNYEIAYNKGRRPLEKRTDKRLDPTNNDVFRDGKFIGKLCTYFADVDTALLLEKIPAAERLCDVRTIESAQELRFAVDASVAEPTYFDPVPEPKTPGKSYNGGYVMASVIQDLKKMLPGMLSVGTGKPVFSKISARIVKNQFLVDINRSLLEGRWWFDAQVVVDSKEWDKISEEKVSAETHRKLGYETAKKCLAAESCLPKVNVKPMRTTAIVDVTLPMEKYRARGIKPILK